MHSEKKRETVSSGVQWEDLAGYCRAIRIDDRILVSGTTASGPEEMKVPEDPADQTRFILNKIERSIQQLGGRLQDVVRTRIYISDMKYCEAVARVHGERFSDIRPANTLVKAELAGEEYLVEIEAEAIIGAGNAL